MTQGTPELTTHSPEATAKFMTKDGWCKTGDIGAVCAEGFMYITDRSACLLPRVLTSLWD